MATLPASEMSPNVSKCLQNVSKMSPNVSGYRLHQSEIPNTLPAPKIYFNFSGSGMTMLCILPQEIHCDSSRCTLHTKNLADLVHPYLKTNYNSGSRTRKVSTVFCIFCDKFNFKFLKLENYRMTVQFYVLVTHQLLKMIKKILNSMKVTKCGLMNLIKKADALF